MEKLSFSPRLSVLPILLLLAGVQGQAASQGKLDGLLLDQAGEPLSNVLVSVVDTSMTAALPLLARTDTRGRVRVSDLQAGTYQIQVKSAQYRSPARKLVKILPGHTAIVTLILQQLLALDAGDQQNLELKTLLRQSADGRLIFRDLPGQGDRRAPFHEAVFQIYTGSGMGSDFMVLPADSGSGTSSQFAVADRMLTGTEYLVAGRLSSGANSMWRLRNFINHRLSDRHELQVYLGFGRMSFADESPALLDNPVSLAPDQPNTSSAATSSLLNAGFEDRLIFSPQITFAWGLEYSRLTTDSRHSFWSPSAQLLIEPLPATRIRMLVTSRRNSRANRLQMPDGRSVSLANSVTLARLGNELSFGTQHHYLASVTRSLGTDTEVEMAMFDNRVQGQALPLVAVFDFERSSELLRLNGEQAGTRGYRVTVRRHLTPGVSTQVSYVRGNTPILTGSSIEGSLLSPTVIGRGVTHMITTQLDAFIPVSSTHLTAVVNIVASGEPLMTVDPLSDVYDVSNQGVNVFVRQGIPFPAALLGFLGLDFLAAHQLEALIDVRNLLNEQLASIQTSDGEASLVRNPRSVRGGISFRF